MQFYVQQAIIGGLEQIQPIDSLQFERQPLPDFKPLNFCGGSRKNSGILGLFR